MFGKCKCREPAKVITSGDNPSKDDMTLSFVESVGAGWMVRRWLPRNAVHLGHYRLCDVPLAKVVAAIANKLELEWDEGTPPGLKWPEKKKR